MRERIARGILVLTFIVILAMAAIFAGRHNPAAAPSGRSPEPPRLPAERPAAPNDGDEGRRVFAAQNCAACHAIKGTGNPRYPLDDVGSRRSRDALRMWITGTGEAAAGLSAGVRRRKQHYQTLPENELNALVAYLSTLATQPQ